MSKVTGKLQITLPKRLAESHGIRVGDEIEFVSAGERIALVTQRQARTLADLGERLRGFDRATQRQRKREQSRELSSERGRGWSREELYERGRAR